MTDLQIARQAKPLHISKIAQKLGLTEQDIIPYGNDKAKIKYAQISGRGNMPKLILVTAVSPTPSGEGKTTMTVGLGDALCRAGKSAVIALREPSLGPVFGMKGGAAGGGLAQVIPMEDINLHFTGDLHAITSAHNLLAALLDNHIQQGNTLGIDPRRVTFRRAMDMNDRQLRKIVSGLGGKMSGVPRECGFDITAASEVMAVFCLSESLTDLQENLAKIVVGYTYTGQPGTGQPGSGRPITAKDLQAEGAMAVLLKDAFNPNLVQTLEHTPAIIHGGPFANIAHGCNSLAATKTAMALAKDYVVTEAGFAADLGAEKFLNIKCRRGGLKPAATVLVATIRALKYQGGGEDLDALQTGLANLERHAENLQSFGVPVVVAINSFGNETPAEIAAVQDRMAKLGIKAAFSESYAKGSKGGEQVAEYVMEAANSGYEKLNHSYEPGDSIEEKITAIATKIYRAGAVRFAPEAARTIAELTELGFGSLPACMAKTQYSFSDNPAALNAPTGFELQISGIKLSAGAGFIVALTGDILTMPGLPKRPAAVDIGIGSGGEVVGLM